MTKNNVMNNFKLIVFCMALGVTAGAVVWAFLKAMSEGMDFIWHFVPSNYDIPFYTLIVCTLGGLIIGLFRKKFGDYPESLDTVLGKVKTEKHYSYDNIVVLLFAALLPLLFGSSVGPEAGLAGVITALCYWVGDNVKFAKENSKVYSEVGMAVSLSVIFYSPLFGIFAVEEDENNEVPNVAKSSKILLYGVAIASAMGIYKLLSYFFGSGMGGFPAFESMEPTRIDYVMLVVYVIAGLILAAFYNYTHHATEELGHKLPAVGKETLAGLCLGLAGTFVPMVMFSGEHEMGELMVDYAHFLPYMLVIIAFLKVLITNICIQFGLKGGHFFPLIFAGVSLGYAIAMFVFPGGDMGHMVFGAAIVTATLLGATMKKPIAVTMLLLLCFPLNSLVWTFVAATLGAKLISFNRLLK